MKTKLFILCCLSITLSQQCTFPQDFKFGVASSAYQVEGAWNASGKTLSIWDYATHAHANKIRDASNGDIACNSYNQIDVDTDILKRLGVDFYRFSISWPRLLTNGTYLNPDGIRYYNELIDRLLANDIEPMVTIFHWDLPQNLQDIGGWTNRKIIEYYVQYAKTCYQLFGDRVKTWITFNEIKTYCVYGYDNYLAPFENSPGEGTYLCAHNMLIAHGITYQTYKTEFRNQGGEMGMAIETPWYYPASNSTKNKMAAQRALITSYDWFVHPMYAISGDYHPKMRQLIDDASKREGRKTSRLPYFTPVEIDLIRGSSDFLGINHYTSLLVSAASPQSRDAYGPEPSYFSDRDLQYSYDPRWDTTAKNFYRVVPNGLYQLLSYTRDNYFNPTMYITENGFSGPVVEQLNDDARIDYMHKYMTAILFSIEVLKVNVRRYTYWALMDNFEWADGYTLRFGLYHVDFNKTQKTRTEKKSVVAYQKVVQNHVVQNCRDYEREFQEENLVDAKTLLNLPFWLKENQGPVLDNP